MLTSEKKKLMVYATMSKNLVLWYGADTAKALAEAVGIAQSTAATRRNSLDSWRADEMGRLFRSCHYSDEEILQFIKGVM